MIQNINKNSPDMSSLNKTDLRFNKNEQSFLTDDLVNDFQSIMEITDSEILEFRRHKLTSPADNEHCNQSSAKHDVDINLRKSTPDILLTDYKHLNDIAFKSENCPDILQCVHQNRNLINAIDITSELKLELNKSKLERNNNCNNNLVSISFDNTLDIDQSVDKEDFWVRTTPADIIGDFEQEVEREFELVVSGYNCLVGGNIILDNKKYQQIRDAALSDGLEHITQDNSGDTIKKNIITSDGTMNVKHVVECLKENTHKIYAQSEFIITSADKESELTNNSRNFEYIQSRSFDEKNQTKLLHLRERLPSLCSLSGKTSQKSEHIPYIKYKKNSYDERQLPPVGIDYKCPATKTRTSRRSQYSVKHINGLQPKLSRMSFASETSRRQEEEEIYQYRKLISCNKEFIISRSKYSKMSFWAQYLTSSVKNINADELINSQKSKLSLKVCETNSNDSMNNFKTLKNHVKSTENSVRNTRFDHDEIRKRLACDIKIGYFIASNSNQFDRTPAENGKVLPLFPVNDLSSYDNKLYCFDSNTHSKRANASQSRTSVFMGILCEETTPIYKNRIIRTPVLINCAKNKNFAATKIQKHLQHLRSDDENNFFTKQARLQIEARTALTQAKDMARFQMTVNQKKRSSSPITNLVRDSLEHIGIQMPYEKRRVSRQILTDINIPKLQIIVNDLHSHIENFNNLLVNYLIVRDELQICQDSMIIDIEELTRYLGAKEKSLGK